MGQLFHYFIVVVIGYYFLLRERALAGEHTHNEMIMHASLAKIRKEVNLYVS
jgi:hypothetical protein